MAVSAPLAEGLAARRGAINAQVAQARLRQPQFDAARLRAFLENALDLALEAVARERPERIAPCTEALVRVAIDLVGSGRDAEPELTALWREVLPRFAHLIAPRPQAVAGALSNAVLEIARWPAARPEQWRARLAAVADSVQDTTTLRRVGQLLAWRAGLAHFRRPVLEMAAGIPDDLARAALDLPPGTDWARWREAALADPWLRLPGMEPAGFHKLGSFTGFGGVFAQPPKARVEDGGFLLRSGARHFRLHADRYGATPLPAAAEAWEAAAEPTRKFAPANALLQQSSWTAPDPQAISTQGSVLILSPWTHAIAVGPEPA